MIAAAAIVVVASYAFSALGRDDPQVALPGAASLADRIDSGGAVALPAPPTPGPEAGAATTDTTELDRLIGVFEDRIQEREDATDMAFLGRLLLIRARRVDNLADYARARDVLEDAVTVAPRYLEALGLLASGRNAMHDFAGAIEVASRVVDEDPANLDALAVLGDALLEVGDVDGARRVYEELDGALPGVPPVMARLSRLAWVAGDAARAVALAAAAEEAAAGGGATGADLAWYRVYRGALAFDQGRLDVAATRFEEALEADPAFGIAAEGLAAVAAAEGDHADALDRYVAATGGVQHPDVLAAMGDLHLLLGDDAAAEELFAEVERLAAGYGVPGPYSRFLALFLADHDRSAAEALRLTTAELEVRRDVHGWDAHAWALYRNGRFEEAREASDAALALGTPEAEFWYHAGLISAAMGDTERAVEELRTALELNPTFDLIHGPEASRVLEDLSAAS